MFSRIGNLEVTYSARGVPTYRVEMWHDGLKKHRLIKSSDVSVARRKAELQMAEWNERWQAIDTKSRERSAKEDLRLQVEANKRSAVDQTMEAQRELDRLGHLLRHTLQVDDTVDWEKLKDKSAFAEPKPKKPRDPEIPPPASLPKEPQPNDPPFQAKLGLIDRLFASRKERILSECESRFRAAHQKWQEAVRRIEASNAKAVEEHQALLKHLHDEHEVAVREWTHRRDAFREAQREQHEAIERRRQAYLSGATDAVVEYCDLVLSTSNYPEYFPQEFTFDYNAANKVLIVDYQLPSPDAIPSTREIKYIQARDEFLPQRLPQAHLDKLYDDVLYQIALRTVHELFEADIVAALAAVVFNGIVQSVDKRTGRELAACVMSLQAMRDEFMSINLANVDPKACFKSLKGVGSSKLHSLTAVAPLLQMQREDPRFVSSYDVANRLDEGFNLAAMDWEDFEHLIREIFAKEFSVSGGEVKVTQASRDGGVDAVAFDPDPIRGGKTVIQAKRYTNTVGVAAVRDLYGTVMNEGANKGILVTTSDFGPDAYNFASGKPLVLLNGANLLHMLSKHGHNAKIDLREARRSLHPAGETPSTPARSSDTY